MWGAIKIQKTQHHHDQHMNHGNRACRTTARQGEKNKIAEFIDGM